MSCKVFFELNLRFAILAFLTALLLAPIRVSAEPVETRAWPHPDFARIVFDWPSPVGFQARLEGNTVVVEFERPIESDFGRLINVLSDHVSDAQLRDNGRSVVLSLRSNYGLRTSRSNNSVVVDLLYAAENDDAAAAPVVPAGGQGQAVGVRVGLHDEYTRVVFDWTQNVDYAVEKTGQEVSIRFNRAATFALGRLGRGERPLVASARVIAEADRVQVAMTVDEGTRLRHFRHGTKVVVDIIRGSGAAEPAPVEAADATEPQAEEQPTADVTAAAPAEPAPDAEPEPEERQVAALPPAGEERGLPPLAPEPGVQMAAAPDPDLVLKGENGLLPVIGEDGREPWQVYARPFTEDTGQPRIAILLANLGLSQSATNAAIQQLPGGVTLGFTPYARSLDLWITEARAAGHEVFLELPMEPFDYPASDPGPHTLLTTLPFANEESSAPFGDNQARLDWLLSRFSGYVGVTNFLGDKFLSDPESLTPVLESLRDRGLMFLDARTAPSSVAGQLAADLALPRALNNRFIDNEASRVAIDARLFELERIAKSEGIAVGIGFPYPVTLERIARWVPTLREKGIVLAPISAVVSRPAE